jgi:hypothetical protein
VDARQRGAGVSEPFTLRNLMDELAECGASPRVMAIVTEIVAKCLAREAHRDVSAAEYRRAKDRERKRPPEGIPRNSTETPIVILNNNIPGGDRGVGKGEPISVEFELHWKAYPLKKSKGKAEKAYIAARKIATSAEIAAGISRLAAEKREPQFWPYMATWLNAKGWLDEAPAKEFRPTSTILPFKPEPPKLSNEEWKKLKEKSQ